MKPVLSTRRARLRPTAAQDLGVVAGCLRHPDVRVFFPEDESVSDEVVASFLARSDAVDAQGLGLWVIEQASGAFIGLAGLRPTEGVLASSSRTAGGVELLIALSSSASGVGLAVEVVDALKEYARETLGLKRLVVGADAPNERFHLLLERCGFFPIGEVEGASHRKTLYEAELTEDFDDWPAI